MALEELVQSFKAKMYDYVYSPFFSSYVIAWIVINYQFVLILISEKEVDQKLLWIKEHPFSYCNLYWYPLAIALIYVFVYPWISLLFYKYTLARDNDKKEAKLNALKQKAYPYEEVVKLFDDIKKYQEEIEKLQSENLTNAEHIQSKYEVIINNMEENINKLKLENEEIIRTKDILINQCNKEIEQLKQSAESHYKNIPNDENNSANDNVMENFEKFMDEYSSEVDGQYSTLIDYLEKQNDVFVTREEIQINFNIPKDRLEILIMNAIKDGRLFDISNGKFLIINKTPFKSIELKILKFLYDTNYSGDYQNGFIESLMKASELKRVQIESLIKGLQQKGIIVIQDSKYVLSDKAKDILLTLFDEHLT